MTEIAEMAFMLMCKEECDGTKPYWADDMPVSSKEIANTLGITRYKALKALHELERDGLIKRACVGCPAVEDGYEYTELVCEAAPPKHGYLLTEAGTASDTYKKAEYEFKKAMEEMCSYLPY